MSHTAKAGRVASRCGRMESRVPDNNAALRRGSLPLGTREVVKLIAVAPDGSSVSIAISSLESVRNVPVSSLAEQSLQKAEDAARGFTFGHIFERTAAH